ASSIRFFSRNFFARSRFLLTSAAIRQSCLCGILPAIGWEERGSWAFQSLIYYNPARNPSQHRLISACRIRHARLICPSLLLAFFHLVSPALSRQTSPMESPRTASAGRLSPERTWLLLFFLYTLLALLTFSYFYLDDMIRQHTGTLGRRILEQTTGVYSAFLLLPPLLRYS